MTKYNYNLKILSNEDSLSYYLLGAFMTDGCIQKNGPRGDGYRSTISSKDLDWIKDIKTHFCPDLKIFFGSHVYILSITNTKISKEFIAKGCVPKKSAILKFPKVPKQFLPDFLRGCFDGDGSLTLYKNKNKWAARSYIVSISEDFAKSIHETLLELGIKNSLNKVIKKPCKISGRVVVQKHIQYRVNLGSKSTCKLLQMIYYPNNILSLNRKENLATKILNTLDYN